MDEPESYRTDPGHDPAEDNIGPFHYKETEDGYRFAFAASDRHCNVTDIVHGGVLMTFADFSACIEATDNYSEENCVTISFSCEFLAAGRKGSLIECRVSLNRRTGSMAFATGEVYSGNEVLLTFSSVMKRLKKGA